MPTLLTKVLPCVACRKLRHFYGVTEAFTPESELCLGCEDEKEQRAWGRQQEQRA